MIQLEDYRYDALSCPRCSNCKWVDHVYVRSHRFAKICPINTRYGFNAYSAHGLLDIALALLDGRLDYTPGLLGAVYRCTLCGACDVRCKRNLDLEILMVLEGLRHRCVRDGQGPPPEHRAISERVASSHNRYGAPAANRLGWLDKRARRAQKAEVLYFVGCNQSYVQKGSARAVAQLLRASGAVFALLGEEEWCCGRPLMAAGLSEPARELMQHNLEALAATGATTIVTGCAECYKTWKVDYPRLLKKSTEGWASGCSI
jgi:Fe-S oxidoreductase